MSAQIRKGTSEDVRNLSTLIRKSYRDIAERFGLTPQNCPTHPSNCTEEWVEREFARGISYWLMFRGTEACGCVAIERASPKLAYLERLAIVPEERRRGLGETLVRHALHEARVSGASTVSVAIIATHLELNAWYQKLGFIEETTRLFSHLPFSVTFLSYRLT